MNIKNELNHYKNNMIYVDKGEGVNNLIEKENKIYRKKFEKKFYQMEDVISSLEKEKGKLLEEQLLLIKVIIDSLDNMDYLITLNNEVNDTVYKFIKIREELVKKLKNMDIEEIYPKAKETFNSELHIAEESLEKEGYEKYEIIEVLKKGYLYKGKIIREAKVIAAK